MQRPVSGRVGAPWAWAVIWLLSGCGAPQIQPAEFLDWVFLPLGGMNDVALSVLPSAYFSDALDPATVSTTSVLLDSTLTAATSTERAEDVCLDFQSLPASAEVSWTGVGGTVAIDPDNPRKAVFTPDGGKLLPTTCYRFSFTTRVRGLSVGPLVQLDKKRQGLGIEQIFYTRS